MFPNTDWSNLAEATLNGDIAGREALSRLCQAYRPPVVAYLRARGWGGPDAEDLAQEFFLRLLESRAWRRAQRQRGRFRTFLIGAVNHVVQHQLEREGAAKRGNALLTSLDAIAEEGFEAPAAPAHTGTFDREWALRIVELAVSSLEERFGEEGRATQFAVLRQYLPGTVESPSYEEAAARLNVSVGNLKSGVHRLRLEFRACLRESVARTVSAPHEVDEELRHLRQVLAEQV